MINTSLKNLPQRLNCNLTITNLRLPVRHFPNINVSSNRSILSTRALSTHSNRSVPAKEETIYSRRNFPSLRKSPSITMVSSLQKQYMSSEVKKAPAIPRPSSSILLLSPQNQILLLHRVQSSSSFPSAHVFPGGNLSDSQDGTIPPPDDPQRHKDGATYRLGAIRECFEESGILLAKTSDGSGLLKVPSAERERARKEIHSGRLVFSEWVAGLGGVVDVDGLKPFTRWITPTNLPKRFTTQMYIYFLPLADEAIEGLPVGEEAVIPVPTSDGGLEHTAALFAPCQTWLEQAKRNEIILFPPQFYLMSLLAPFLSAGAKGEELGREELGRQRTHILRFLETDGDGRGILWADKVMSPLAMQYAKDGRSVLGLDNPGRELAKSGRGGDYERVVLVKFGKEGPRNVEVRQRSEILEERREKL